MKAPNTDHVVLYGSLMSGLRQPDAPHLEGLLRLVGPCVARGALYDLGDYPGMIRTGRVDGRVVGELYEVLDPRVFRLLDEFERYDAEDLTGSLYLRRLLRLETPDCDAWIYLYNRSVEDRPSIPSGDWRAHVGSRSPS